MHRFFPVTLSLGLLYSFAVGQPGFGQRGGGSRPGAAGAATLERAGLKIGQSLPDLTVYDESGNRFRIATMQGKHTVIVFGCMT